MTPDEFEAKMRGVFPNGETQLDTEEAHGIADVLLCQALRELGYGKGVDIFKEGRKWYG